MFDWFQKIAFEAPATVALGPEVAALACGFAVMLGGVIYLTPSGARYLRVVDIEDGERGSVPFR